MGELGDRGQNSVEVPAGRVPSQKPGDVPWELGGEHPDRCLCLGKGSTAAPQRAPGGLRAG